MEFYTFFGVTLGHMDPTISYIHTVDVFIFVAYAVEFH